MPVKKDPIKETSKLPRDIQLFLDITNLGEIRANIIKNLIEAMLKEELNRPAATDIDTPYKQG